MALRDLRDIRGPLVLPIYGKEYTIPPVPADLGARFKLAAEGKPDDELLNATDEDYYRLILGSAYDEMLADVVDRTDIELAYFTAMAEYRSGRAAAERTWEAGRVDPNLIAALRAAAEEAMTKRNSPASRRSPSMAKASKTPRAGSSSTTSQPATPRPAKRPPAKASSGARSSTK